MISSENAGKVTKEGKFPCAVCRKGVDSSFIPCQFCRCWVQTKSIGIRRKLEGNSKLKCQTYANHQMDKGEGQT